MSVTPIKKIRTQDGDAQIDYAALVNVPKGESGGLAGLDDNGKVAAAQASAKVISKSANFTLAASDLGKLLRVTNGITITIPSGLDGEVEIWQDGGSTVTINGNGVTFYFPGNADTATSFTISDTYGLIAGKALSSTEWLFAGSV